MTEFLQHMINMLILGSTYALLGIGLTLIFGIMKIVNFAHGELYAFGAYFVYFVAILLGFNFFLSLLIAIVAGAILGARKGFLAVLTFEVLAFAGLPILAGGRGGVVWFTTAPSAGFLWGWLAGAAVIGALTARILPKYPLWQGILVTAVGGMLVVYAIGIPVLAHNAHISLRAATAANGWFLLGDSVKVVITALVAKQVHRAYPGLIVTRRSTPAVPHVG